MIRISDYIFEFLRNKGANYVFMVPGGGAMYLVDSIGKSKLNYICMQHEQAAACAAEAYGQHTNAPGIVLVTAGPGGTNTLTGVAAAWLDSTPMIVISGQAKRADLVANRGVRQIGSQEVQIVDMVRPITKYAVQILEPSEIRYHLERAYCEASTGRMGPVWLDIPLDIQSAMVEINSLKGYEPQLIKNDVENNDITTWIQLLSESKKPLILAGNGVKTSIAEEELISFADAYNIPICTTWKSMDMIEEDNSLYVGHPGVMGDRGANFILQESDLLIILGSRVDNSITAYNEANFAPKAKKIIVDIDEAEIKKFSMEFSVAITGDVKYVLQRIISEVDSKKIKKFSEWLQYCKELRAHYPVIDEKYYESNAKISIYHFIDILSNQLTCNDIIVPECSGGAAEITCQAFRIKKGQKMKHAAGLGSMGFGLPYAIGSCLANEKKRTILINGDGAFQLNIQELETLHRLQLPVKIFILNNNGYASIKNMQRNNFEGHYVASTPESGITMPNTGAIAKAYGISTWQTCTNEEMERQIAQVLESPGPTLCELIVSSEETVSPRVKTIKLEDGSLISTSLDNMWPFLDNEKRIL